MMAPILPNFYVLGAAKAGTTSLYYALKHHPEIFMTAVKEPHFFDIDANYARGLAYYSHTYFRGADAYIARGEATPAYLHLFDRIAPRLLQAYAGMDEQPKFVVSLRDPVQRAWSHYMHRVRVAMESETLEKAIALEDARLSQRPTEWVGYYRDGLYGQMLRQWFSRFGRERFCIFLVQDLTDDPQGVSKTLLEFLGVNAAITLDFSRRENTIARPRSQQLMHFLTDPSILKEPFKAVLPKTTRRRIKEFLYRKNTRAYEVKPQMEAALEADLRQRYRDDVLLLQSLLERDLSAWLPPVS